MHALYDIELMKMLAPNQHQESSGERAFDKMRKFLSSPLMRKKPSVLHLKTFGTPLDILLQKTPSDHSVPHIITRLCQYIQKTGLTHEGLFRISGNARSVERLRVSFDRTGDAPLETEGDVPSAAALLKLFLRELPDPIIPLAMHCQFLEAVKDKDRAESIPCLSQLVEKLPAINYNILSYLSCFLKQVSEMEEQNRMSASSLGIVFGPNLFRVTEDFVGLKEQSLTNQIVTYFITDYDDIFKKEIVGDIFAASCLSQSMINSSNHQVASMVASWPETKERSASKLSTWSLGPISAQMPAVNDSYLPLHASTSSVEEDKLQRLSNDQEEVIFATVNHFNCSEQESSIEFSSISPDNVSFEISATSTSVLSQSFENKCTNFAKDSGFQDGSNSDVEQSFSRFGMRDANTSADSSNSYVVTDKKLSSSFNGRNHHSLENSIVIQKDMIHQSEELSPKISVERYCSSQETPEHLKETHKSYPRGRRRHVRHHKNKELGSDERRSRSELRSASRYATEDCNGNASSLSQTSKNELQYSSTGTLDESGSDLRHSWPAFRKTHEDDIALSPLPQQLGLNQCSEASVSPSAFRSYLSHRNLHLDPNLPPSPPVEQEDIVIGGAHEVPTSNAKQLSRKVHALKKKIKLFEENFEKLYGYKPSHVEKHNNIAVKKMLCELNKAKLDLKQLRDESLLWNSDDGAQNKSSKGTNTKSSQGLFSVGLSLNMTLEDSVKEALEYLAKHRKDGKRPEPLEEMNREQLIAEKVVHQKVLLNLENMHGRPSTKAHRELVRPLYDRYRDSKRHIARMSSSKDTADLQPILENEAMDFRAADQSNTNVEKSSHVSIEEAKHNHCSGKEEANLKLLSPHINFHELSAAELTEELDTVREEKRKLRKTLRDFEDKFKKEHGRKAQREDKRVMESHYTQYKNTKAKLKLLEALVAKHEQAS